MFLSLDRVLWRACRALGNMPFKWQYKLSDVVFFILYKVLKYRVRVTRENLHNSFPEKGEEELLNIEIDFYRHLADIFIETLTLSSFTKEEMRRRIIYINYEEFNKSLESRSSIATMAHMASWEYTIGYSLYTDKQVLAVYHPLSNRNIDNFYKRMRSIFGTKPVAMSSVAKEIVNARNQGKKVALALIADQTPPKSQIKEWIDFLGQPTAFFQGAEKLALKYGMPVAFLDVTKVRRGYYSAYFSMIYDGKESVKEGEITRRYAARLEEVIRREPHLWMWSHKRWKHKPEVLN